MRGVLLACALIAVSCDPVNTITVRFPIDAPAKVIAYWVQTYEGRAYAHGQVFKGDAAAPEFTVARRECCGTAAAYRDDELWFIACVEKQGADPVLVCGRPGTPPANLVRAPRPGTTCDALDREISSADIAIATCTLTTRAAGAGSR
jgi:hypothetical protein